MSIRSFPRCTCGCEFAEHSAQPNQNGAWRFACNKHGCGCVDYSQERTRIASDMIRAVRESNVLRAALDEIEAAYKTVHLPTEYSDRIDDNEKAYLHAIDRARFSEEKLARIATIIKNAREKLK